MHNVGEDIDGYDMIWNCFAHIDLDFDRLMPFTCFLQILLTLVVRTSLKSATAEPHPPRREENQGLGQGGA